VAVAGVVWREIATAESWSRTPIGVLISVYAGANILYQVLASRGTATDLAVRMALALVMVLLALIGGRVTPSFTSELLETEGKTERPAPFSLFDGASIMFVAIAALAWTMNPYTRATGWMLVAAGLLNFCRLLRWHSWATRHRPLVLILAKGATHHGSY